MASPRAVRCSLLLRSHLVSTSSHLSSGLSPGPSLHVIHVHLRALVGTQKWSARAEPRGAARGPVKASTTSRPGSNIKTSAALLGHLLLRRESPSHLGESRGSPTGTIVSEVAGGAPVSCLWTVAERWLDHRTDSMGPDREPRPDGTPARPGVGRVQNRSNAQVMRE